MTREAVVMLKLLEAKLEHEGRIREWIATVGRMLERGAEWEMIEEFTGVDEDGLNTLRAELGTVQEDKRHAPFPTTLKRRNGSRAKLWKRRWPMSGARLVPRLYAPDIALNNCLIVEYGPFPIRCRNAAFGTG